MITPTMLAAILRGRLGAIEHSEDLLTALTFGVLAWIPAPLGYVRLLEAADPRPDWLGTICTVETTLWPWWDHSELLTGAEPDAVLRLLSAGKRRERLLAVECKRGAGKSGRGEQDQLARQAASGAQLAAEQGLDFAGVLYLTEHLTRPEGDIAASREALRRIDMPNAPLYWCSWLALRTILLDAAEMIGRSSPLEAALCRDLATCLERWGLARFEGFSDLSPAPRFSLPTSYRWPEMLSAPTFWEER